MMAYEGVTVRRAAFAFCRWSMAALMWLGVCLRSELAVGICACFMAANTTLTVGRAPLVMLYTWTIERIVPSSPVVIDKAGMRFGHGVATFAMGIPLLVAHLSGPGTQDAMWRVLVFVACFKTLGALGFCPASRWYSCLASGGQCCRFLRGRGE